MHVKRVPDIALNMGKAIHNWVKAGRELQKSAIFGCKY